MSEMLFPIEAKYREMGFESEADKVAALRQELECGEMPTSFRPTIDDMKPNTVMKHSYFQYAPVEKTIISPNGDTQRLTGIPNRLLFELISNVQSVVDSRSLAQAGLDLRLSDRNEATKVIKGHINKIREAFKNVQIDPQILRSMIGHGYMLVDPNIQIIYSAHEVEHEEKKYKMANYDYVPSKPAFMVDGNEVPLTLLEANLYNRLFSDRGRTVGKIKLVKAGWEVSESGDEYLLKTHFSHIRSKASSKLHPVPSDIVGVPRIGYRLLTEDQYKYMHPHVILENPTLTTAQDDKLT